MIHRLLQLVICASIILNSQFSILNSVRAQTQWLPEKTDRLVNDYSGVLTAAQANEMDNRLKAFSDTTSNQVLIVITPTIYGDDEDAVAQRIGQAWGVGQQEFNNGVVILIKSKTEEENWGAVAIATGYGAEGALPDLFCKRIIDDCMLSPLGNGDYYRALDEALEIILPVLAGEYSYAQYRKDERRSLLLALGSMLLIIVAVVVVLRRYAKNHPEQFHNNGGGKGGGMWFGGPMGGSSWGGRSSWGGGSSWGGFGGGSFGGGGASGRFILLLVLLPLSSMAQESNFERWFTGGTLRIDCLREGSALGDTVWVERWTDRKAPWHGSYTQLLDPFDNGDYRVVMRDAATGRDIYSRGYSNLFREYKDTPEGRTVNKRFEETLLVPMPKGKVVVALQKRDANMKLHDQTVLTFQPKDLKDSKDLKDPKDLKDSKDPKVPTTISSLSVKFDVAFVMQGFDDASEADYRQVCDRMANVLFGKEPFRSHREDFNIYFVKGDAGVEYNTFGADRYAMTFKLWQLHDVLGTTPCDHVIIVLNNEKYGGGAIYNFYSVSSLHSMAESVLPHELGHGIGGLADEYVDEDLSYSDLHRTAYEPLEPNITNLVDFDSKWKYLLSEGTLVPTPADASVPRNQNGPLGVYEGAGYSSSGVFRPTMRCMMRDYAPFCPVCRNRLEAIISLYTR